MKYCDYKTNPSPNTTGQSYQTIQTLMEVLQIHVLPLIYQETPQGMTFRPTQVNALIWTAETSTQANNCIDHFVKQLTVCC